MLDWTYVVSVPVCGTDNWYDLVRSNDPAVIGEIVRVLLAAKGGGPRSIRVDSQLKERET